MCDPAQSGRSFFHPHSSKISCTGGGREKCGDTLAVPSPDFGRKKRLFASSPSITTVTPKASDSIMATTATNILLTFGLCLLMACTTVSASALYCRVGQDKCAGWGYTGQINQNVVCCPTLSGQGFTMNMGLKAPENCKCNVGTAEEYPDDSNSASVPTGSRILGVLATLIMVFSLLVL